MLQAIGQFVAACGQRVDGSDQVGDELPIDALPPVRDPPHHADAPLPRGRFSGGTIRMSHSR